MAFPPCRAASAIRMAISTMSAATATGGVPLSTVAATPTTGVWATAARACTTTTALRAACSVFVAFRTEGAFTRPPLAKQAVQLNVVGVH